MDELAKLNRAIELLTSWVGKIMVSNAIEYYDINKVSEHFAMHLLNAVYGWHLQDLNRERRNFPAVDLGDDDAELAVQVTSTVDDSKVRSTLEKFVAHKLDVRFSNGVRFLSLSFNELKIGKKSGAAYPPFEPDDHIVTPAALIQEINDCYQNDRVRFALILEVLERFSPTSTVADYAPFPGAGPPKPAHFIGRDLLAAELVGLLLAASPLPIAILGPAGIGKSTLSLAALHKNEIIERNGARRWFIRLDAAATVDAVVGKINEMLDVRERGNPRRALRAELAKAPAILVLDNLETPWEGERQATEAFLTELVAIPGLALVVSIRGTQTPAGVAWNKMIRVDPFTPELSAELFCAIAPEHRGDASLTSLLAPVGGIPLAITLLAHAAEGNDLQNLAIEWTRHRTALLKRSGAQPDRLSSWAVSIELSIASRRMTPEATRLGALLAALPDGIAVEDLRDVFPDGNATGRILAQVGLAFFEGGRLQMLAPIREHFLREHEAAVSDLDRAMEHYGELVQSLGGKAGGPGGAEAVVRLTPETANLDTMLRRGLGTGESKRWVHATIRLAQFARLSGRSTLSPLADARRVAHVTGETFEEADCVSNLGHIAFARSDYDQAQARFDEAVPLYRKVSSAQGEANCIVGAADIALLRSQHDQALARYEDARSLYRTAGDVVGEANCILRMGDIADWRSDHEEAQSRYEEALLLYRKAGGARGAVNCIMGMANVALARSDYDQAQARYEEARPVYRTAGDTLGEANCIKGMGDIAFDRSRHEEALARYGEALPLYRQLGWVLGEANCILNMGHIAFARSEDGQARERLRMALDLYGRIPEPYSMGQVHRLLAQHAFNSADKQYHLESARACFSSIPRPDLLANLDREFGP